MTTTISSPSTSGSGEGRRRCRICKKPEGDRHKMSCDYVRYPSRYPDGPVWVPAPVRQQNPPARGECPTCHAPVHITRNDRVGWHYGRTDAGYSTGTKCDGAGLPHTPPGAMTAGAGALPHRAFPCARCPWKRSTPAGEFPAERYESLACTSIQNDGVQPGLHAPMFACHKSPEGAEEACAGWLAAAGHGHIGVRLAVATGRLSGDALTPGDDWPDLFDTYAEMAAHQAAHHDGTPPRPAPPSAPTSRAGSGVRGTFTATPCPACRMPKPARLYLCGGCWDLLPLAARHSLSRRGDRGLALVRLRQLHDHIDARRPLPDLVITP